MPHFALVTFGCQMNQHDSDRIGEVLRSAGYLRVAAAKDADVVILNTCSVREKAEQKLRSEVGRMAQLKRTRSDLVIGVAGCVAQQEGDRLLRSMPHVDLIVGPDNISELPELLADAERGAPAAVRAEFDLDSPKFLRADPAAGEVRPTAFVTTMKGCDERCSFCIVPTTRGPERYRPSSEVLDECERLVSAGVKEITLLGQTVDSYIDPEGALPKPDVPDIAPLRHGAQRVRDETQFPSLLFAIARRVPELRRLRYTSPHPRHLTPSLVRAHAELSVLAKHVHMPVQSGSDRLLKRMLRRYTVAEYIERTDALLRAVPGLTLSTDIIVGFPGESRADFEKTLELVRDRRFASVFGFKYSQRPGTPALKLEDDVSEEEKSTRLAELFELSEGLRREQLQKLVGTTQSVLVEGPGQAGSYTGRTERNEIVHFECDQDPTGLIVDVTIQQAFKHSLRGDAVTLSRSSRPSPQRRALPVVI